MEDGYIQLISHSNKEYGNSVWIRYPRINISVFYAHLDRICVKKKQKVNNNTIIGYSGKTGNATGIHFHLGMTLIGSNTWLNPHEYDYKETICYLFWSKIINTMISFLIIKCYNVLY